MTVYLFHVVEEKTQNPCSFASVKKPSKTKAFAFIRYIVLASRKLKTKAKTNLQTRTHKSHGWTIVTVKSWNQFLAGFVTRMWLCWRMFPQAPGLVHLGSFPVKTSIAPRGIQAKISLLTLLPERRNSDLAKDILREEKLLSPLCNWYELYC